MCAATYRVDVDPDELDAGEWDGSDITVDVSHLEVGTYTLKLTLTDLNENEASATVPVTITGPEPTTSPTTTTSPTGPTNPGLEIDPIPLGIGAMSAVVVIAIVVIALRKE